MTQDRPSGCVSYPDCAPATGRFGAYAFAHATDPAMAAIAGLYGRRVGGGSLAVANGHPAQAAAAAVGRLCVKTADRTGTIPGAREAGPERRRRAGRRGLPGRTRHGRGTPVRTVMAAR